MTTRSVLVGVHPTSTDCSMPVVDLARACEARGLASLTLPEHTHIPVDSRDTADRYQRTLDPFIASAFAAAATTALEVGSAISLVAQHDAIALAKAIATLEHLAPGRVIVGVGFGYNHPEIADHGIPVADRALVVEETVRLMRALWSDDEAHFDGQHRRLAPSWSWPKPLPGAPPVLLGVRASDRNFERIVDWADGWIPMGNGIATNPDLEESLTDLRKRWSDAGRTAELEVCCFFPVGTVSEMTREVERARELGIRRPQVYLEDRTAEEALPILDDLGVVVDRLGR